VGKEVEEKKIIAALSVDGRRVRCRRRVDAVLT
jgi:hypothetical protein